MKEKSLYQRAHAVLKPFYFLLVRPRIFGQENIPESGAFILCSNHKSNWDPVILGLATPRPIFYLAKKELFQIKVLSALLRNLGAIPVDRGKQDLESVKQGLRLLKNGQILGIFPEGTRNVNEELLPFHTGAAHFSIKTKVPIIPAYLKSRSVVFGKPLHWNEKKNETALELTKRLTEIMAELKKT